MIFIQKLTPIELGRFSQALDAHGPAGQPAVPVGALAGQQLRKRRTSISAAVAGVKAQRATVTRRTPPTKRLSPLSTVQAVEGLTQILKRRSFRSFGPKQCG